MGKFSEFPSTCDCVGGSHHHPDWMLLSTY